MHLLADAYILIDRAAKQDGFEFYRDHVPADDPLVPLWPRVSPHSVTDIYRARSVFDRLRTSLPLNGDVIECGVAHGGMSLILGSALRSVSSPKRLLLCDTFEGLPPPDRRFDHAYEAGWFWVGTKNIQRRFQEFGLAELADFHIGLFSDTLPRLPEHQRFSFAHIDGDLYASTKDCLANLYERLAPGAPMVFDDYYDTSGGVMRAVNEHVTTTRELVSLGPVGQVTVRKGVTVESGDAFFEMKTVDAVGGHTVPVAVTELRQMEVYVDFVRRVLEGAASAEARDVLTRYLEMILTG